MASTLNDCGCCEGLTAIVPEAVLNRPGLAQIVYRIGTHDEFLRSALAALSDPQYPTLRGLTTRETDDFTIALLDGWATLADVFTFYQERIANESYLRTATESLSVSALAALIGYSLRPGVAASADLAFLMEEAVAAGVPRLTNIPIGTAVQSIPGPGEQPQTFETIEQIEARPGWNALLPQTTELIIPGVDAQEVFLAGTANNLKAGDALLFVGADREQHAESDHWDFRLIETVEINRAANYTRVTWSRGLGVPKSAPATSPKVFVFRQRTAPFGWNAPDWRTMPASVRKQFAGQNYNAISEWPNFNIAHAASVPATLDHIFLDAVFPKIVVNSWLALTTPDYVELYQVVSTTATAIADFALSSKVSQLQLSGENLAAKFGGALREIVIFGESEEIEYSAQPLIRNSGPIALAPGVLLPIAGDQLTLAQPVPDLLAGRRVIVSGKPIRVQVLAKIAPSAIQPDESGLSLTIAVGDQLQLLASPIVLSNGNVQLHVADAHGVSALITSAPENFLLQPANANDEVQSETAVLQSIDAAGAQLVFGANLRGIYDRATVVVYGNVAAATHGETKQEVLGNGDASQTDQTFTLKQPPLTYVASTAPSGAASTLAVRVNDLLWHEVPTFYGHGPRERIFTTRASDDGKTTVEFGDGVKGARLPSGNENVAAQYRKGLGPAGNLKAGQLSLLMSRPLGVKSALNPAPASGGADGEQLEDSRQNAPFTVLTLDRVVSLADYENFSRTYAGVAKALATWTWNGRTRGVFLTVAGSLGAEVSAALMQNLITAIHAAGDPFVPVRVASYEPALFRVSGRIKIDPDYESDKVLTAAGDVLRAGYSFANRDFGQSVPLSEVIALLQSVAGVIAVNLKSLYRTGSAAKLNARLDAGLPNGGDPNSLGAAELLMLDPAPIDLEVMP